MFTNTFLQHSPLWRVLCSFFFPLCLPWPFKAHHYIVAILQRSNKCYWETIFVLCIIIARRIEFLSFCFGRSHISAASLHSYILAIGLFSVSSVLCSLYSHFVAPVFNESGLVFLLFGKLSGVVSYYPLNHNISWQSFVILACVWPNLSGCILLKEPSIHSSLKLTGVYIVIFSFNSHSWV